MGGTFWGPGSETKWDKGLVLPKVNGSGAAGLALTIPCCMPTFRVLDELLVTGLKMGLAGGCWLGRWLVGVRLRIREHCGVKDCCGKPGLASFSGR